MDEVQRGAQGGVGIAEEIILVLVAGEQAALIKGQGGGEPAQEGVAQPGLPGHVHQLAPAGQHGEVALDLLARHIVHWHDEAVVLDLQDGAGAVEELAPGHKGVGLRLEAAAQPRLAAAVDRGLQLGGVAGQGIDGGAAQVALVHAAIPAGKGRCIGGQRFPKAAVLGLSAAFAKEGIKQAHGAHLL